MLTMFIVMLSFTVSKSTKLSTRPISILEPTGSIFSLTATILKTFSCLRNPVPILNQGYLNSFYPKELYYLFYLRNTVIFFAQTARAKHLAL